MLFFFLVGHGSDNHYRKYLYGENTIGKRNICDWEIVPYNTLTDDFELCKMSVFGVASNYECIWSRDMPPFNFPNIPNFILYIRAYDIKHYDTKRMKIFNVNELIGNLKHFVSHPLNVNTYKQIVEKFEEKDNYSFVVMKDNDISNKHYKCYEVKD
eukprot:328138_1